MGFEPTRGVLSTPIPTGAQVRRVCLFHHYGMLRVPVRLLAESVGVEPIGVRAPALGLIGPDTHREMDALLL